MYELGQRPANVETGFACWSRASSVSISSVIADYRMTALSACEALTMKLDRSLYCDNAIGLLPVDPSPTCPDSCQYPMRSFPRMHSSFLRHFARSSPSACPPLWFSTRKARGARRRLMTC